MTEPDFPLRPGTESDVVRDLHRRLHDLGHVRLPGHDSLFDEQTEDLVRSFQEEHGLDPSGLCDKTTWAALVEGGYRLGDRFLYLHRPMLRGDDVSQLQLAVSALGFDAGRVDGIFGPDTRRALSEFQRNVGLAADGIVGPDVSAALERLGHHPDRATPVSTVRERDTLGHRALLLQTSKIIVGDQGGLPVLTNAIARHLRDAGAHVVTTQHPDPVEHASQANNYEADLYLGVDIDRADGALCRYFEVDAFQSVGGRRLAECAAEALRSVLETTVDIRGMRLPVLRLTRMPAVAVRVGPPRTVVRRAPELSVALGDAVIEWLSEPLSTP